MFTSVTRVLFVAYVVQWNQFVLVMEALGSR